VSAANVSAAATSGTDSTTRPGLLARFAALRHRHRLGLRARIMVTFGFGAFVLSLLLAITTYNFTKSNLLHQRDSASVDQAYDNAQRLLLDLRSEPPTAQGLLDGLGANRPLLRYHGAWTPSDVNFDDQVLPASLLARVVEDQVPARMLIRVNDEPVLAIGIPLREVDASYFEFSDYTTVSSTLQSVLLALVFASVITTLAGVTLGVIAGRRTARPLVAASQAAKAIADGRLDTRLAPADDPDLQRLTESFNEMVAALEQRVDREARFTSDVSHELRSPLMTLSASAEVMQARREEMPERAQAALDLLVADVTRFQGLVEDLLEISRFDAGAIRLHLEEFGVAEFVRQAVAVSSLPKTDVSVSDRAEAILVNGDKRRLARVVANLIDNARAHGGGELTVEVCEPDDVTDPLDRVWIVVEDHGPGVPAEERATVFQRFARGSAAGRRGGSEGAGLGLALVDEHVRLHGGRVWVDDRADGEPGARFCIELPAEEIAP
jgi:signal transduction histidine kinase